MARYYRSPIVAAVMLVAALAPIAAPRTTDAQSIGERLRKSAEEAAKRAAEVRAAQAAAEATNAAIDGAANAVKCAASDSKCAADAKKAGKQVQTVPDSAAGGKDLYKALEETGRVTAEGIFFDTNSDKIRPESETALKQIADMMSSHPDVKIMIEGHTDDVGSAATNQALSEKRAARSRPTSRPSSASARRA